MAPNDYCMIHILIEFRRNCTVLIKCFIYTDETKKIQLLTLNNNKKPNATKWDPPILDTDTKETIRDKFPKASEYEMEFLAFLARK